MTGSGAAPSGAMPRSLVLVGAGKMGGALLEGWLAQGLSAAAIAVVEPRPSPELSERSRRLGFRLGEGPDGIEPPDTSRVDAGSGPEQADEGVRVSIPS